MKKTIFVIALLTSGFTFAASQATDLGLVRVQVSSATLAVVNQTTPRGAWELIACTDCTLSKLCISSGTTKGSYVVGVATGTFNGGLVPHCQ